MVLLSPQGDCKRNIYNFELPRSRAGETLQGLVWIISSILDNWPFREFSFFSSFLNSDSYTVKSKGTALIPHSAATQGFQNDPGTTCITESQNWKGPYLRNDSVSQDPWLKAEDWTMDKLGRKELARRLAGNSEVNGRLEKEAWEWKPNVLWRARKQEFW